MMLKHPAERARMSNLQALADAVGADRVVSAAEALELRKAIFPDGIVSREEAEALIALEARVANTDEAWVAAFVEGIVDHVLGAGQFNGHVEPDVADWLIGRFGDDGARETELEVVLKLMERSESAPESLSLFAQWRIASQFAGKAIGVPETELIRRCLYASSGDGATAITETEARWLFALDAESDGRANAGAWGDLFVKAILNHLMGRRAPRLLASENMLARQAWIDAEPRRAVAAMFDGGVHGFLAKMRQDSMLARLEQRYEEMNAAAEDDARLTLEEIAWTVGMARQDGKRTKNEAALLAEIRALEPNAAT
jgi:hypothetical protein